MLVGGHLKFLQTQSCSFSIVVPDLTPRQYCWPLLQSSCSAAFLLGKKGVSGVCSFLTEELLVLEPVHYNGTCGSSESFPPPNVYVVFKQVYPHVPRSWKPADSWPECHYANDVGFQSARSHKSYERQKCRLQQELETYLASLPQPKALISTSPGDLIRFCICECRYIVVMRVTVTVTVMLACSQSLNA